MDEVAKRREARRRKILENSQNRLNRITGIEQKSSTTDVPELQITTENDSETENSTVFPTNIEITSERNELKQVKLPPKQYRAIVLTGLAIFINILLTLSVKYLKFNSGSSRLNNIFLPLLIYEVTDFFSSQKRRSENKSFIFLLLIANAKNSHLVTVIKQLELLASVLQDLMIYFFVFVCCEFVKVVVVS